MLSWFRSANIRDIFYLDIEFLHFREIVQGIWRARDCSHHKNKKLKSDRRCDNLDYIFMGVFLGDKQTSRITDTEIS